MRTLKNSFFCMKGIKYDETKYRDLDGNIVKVNPMEQPYNYDTYVIYKSPFFRKTDTEYCFGSGPENSKETVKALNKMGLKRYGASYERLCCENPQQVETFLSIIMKRDVKCTAITKGCYGDGNPRYTAYIQ